MAIGKYPEVRLATARKRRSASSARGEKANGTSGLIAFIEQGRASREQLVFLLGLETQCVDF